ncbi:MAG: hypothetical protein HY520_03015 [Candidatus Aenigmarchaeota archaeon]|nr:hypothetical protein [Candidatus Aenigmarchaeota archaeon]
MKQNVGKIVGVALDFIRQAGYEYFKIDKIVQDPQGARWIVTINVGIIGPELKEVIVDDTTGEVVSFQ